MVVIVSWAGVGGCLGGIWDSLTGSTHIGGQEVCWLLPSL